MKAKTFSETSCKLEFCYYTFYGIFMLLISEHIHNVPTSIRDLGLN